MVVGEGAESLKIRMEASGCFVELGRLSCGSGCRLAWKGFFIFYTCVSRSFKCSVISEHLQKLECLVRANAVLVRTS
jgi:hypothetical protein